MGTEVYIPSRASEGVVTRRIFIERLSDQFGVLLGTKGLGRDEREPLKRRSSVNENVTCDYRIRREGTPGSLRHETKIRLDRDYRLRTRSTIIMRSVVVETCRKCLPDIPNHRTGIAPRDSGVTAYGSVATDCMTRATTSTKGIYQE